MFDILKSHLWSAADILRGSLDLEIIYIILHEVCHLKIKGHSHHYWDLVYRYMPDYQDKIDWLKINGIMINIANVRGQKDFKPAN